MWLGSGDLSFKFPLNLAKIDSQFICFHFLTSLNIFLLSSTPNPAVIFHTAIVEASPACLPEVIVVETVMVLCPSILCLGVTVGFGGQGCPWVSFFPLLKFSPVLVFMGHE